MSTFSLDFETFEKRFTSRDILTIEPLLAFLNDIGSPHKTLPPTIHVAGTNGKGSTIAMLRALYEAQGYKVHTITSPHLYDLTERLVLASQQISQEALWNAFQHYESLAFKYALSWYEMMIGVSLKLCAKTPADVLLLETGLGGEFDATNVIDTPALSIITPISLDHYDFLGGDIKEIARAKAGIIKENCPILSAPQTSEVEAILSQKAKDFSAPFTKVCLEGDLPHPNLPGEHQRENAALAIEAVTLLEDKLPMTNEAISAGLGAINWPGRLENLGKKKGCQLWFDVAHNPASARAVQDFFKKRPGKKTLIFALLKSKDAKETLRPLAETFDSIIFFEANEPERYHSPEILQKIAQDFGKTTTLSPDFQQAFYIASKDKPKEILTAGSHYIARTLYIIAKRSGFG